MTIYSIILIAITLAYISSKVLNIAAFAFSYKDKIFTQDPSPTVINQFGMKIFTNVFKSGLFTLVSVILDNAIFSENWPVVIILVTTLIFLVPIDYYMK